MSAKTQIEWTNTTWNPVRGCSRVSEGCRNCYAEVQAARVNACQHGNGVPEGNAAYDGLLAKGGQWNGKIKCVPEALEKPFSWKKPQRIFVNSMGDLFHENVPEKFIDRVFAVMALANNHVFQILTKRPQRMQEYLNNFTFDRMIENCMDEEGYSQIPRYTMQKIMHLFGKFPSSMLYPIEPRRNQWPLPNVWLGVSVEDQKTADARIPLLLQVPAAVRWVSAEPLLGTVNLESTLGGTQWIGGQRGCHGTHKGNGTEDCPHDKHHHHDHRCNRGLDWVVVGGESGSNARPMHPDWVRGLRDQCSAAGVTFFFKQWGEWTQRSLMTINGKPHGGSMDFGAVDPQCKKWPDIIRMCDCGGDGRTDCGILPACNCGGGHTLYVQKVGKKASGRILDGVLHDEYPTAKEGSHAN